MDASPGRQNPSWSRAELRRHGVMGEPTCGKTAFIDEVTRSIAQCESAAGGPPVEGVGERSTIRAR